LVVWCNFIVAESSSSKDPGYHRDFLILAMGKTMSSGMICVLPGAKPRRVANSAEDRLVLSPNPVASCLSCNGLIHPIIGSRKKCACPDCKTIHDWITIPASLIDELREAGVVIHRRKNLQHPERTDYFRLRSRGTVLDQSKWRRDLNDQDK
jgi:hypothetical protein